MKKNLSIFFIILVAVQVILIIIGISQFNDFGTTKFLNIGLIISLINLIILSSKMIIKELRLSEKIENPDYFRNLDFKMINPIAAGLVTKTSTIGFNSVLIIIYELIEKGVFVRRYKHHQTYIKLKNGITLEEIQKLTSEEQTIIKTIFNGTDDHNEYEINQIIVDIEQDINKSHSLNLVLKEIKQKLKLKYFHSYLWSLDEKIITPMCYTIVIPIIGFIPFIGISTVKPLNIGLILTYCLYITNIIIYIIFINKKFPREQYLNEIKKLNGLYNFLNDFSNIKNAEIKYIEIYDKYYLYALGMGLTERIEEQYNFAAIDIKLKSNLKYLFYNEGAKEND